MPKRAIPFSCCRMDREIADSRLSTGDLAPCPSHAHDALAAPEFENGKRILVGPVPTGRIFRSPASTVNDLDSIHIGSVPNTDGRDLTASENLRIGAIVELDVALASLDDSVFD